MGDFFGPSYEKVVIWGGVVLVFLLGAVCGGAIVQIAYWLQ